MKHLFLLLLLLLAPPGAAGAQAQTQLTAAQLWQALRQHPQADQQHVDLLNELADERLRTIEAARFEQLKWSQIDSLTTLAFALARQLHYPRGEIYATLLNPGVVAAIHLSDEAFDWRKWSEQDLLPQLMRLGDNRLLSDGLILVIFLDKFNKENPRYLRRMMTAARAAHSPRALCHAYRGEVFYYRGLGKYYQGLQSAAQQLRTAQQAGLADEIVDALSVSGDLYVDAADYTQAIEFYERALSQVEQVTPASYQVLIRHGALNGLGYGYLRGGNYPKALAALQQATRVSATANELTIQSNYMIADIYERQRNPRALPYLRQVLQQARHDGSYSALIALSTIMGRYYLHAGQADSAVVNGQRALALMNSTGRATEDKIEVLQLLYQAYALRRQYEQAYRYQSRYLGLRDTIGNEQTARRITALRFSQDVAQQRSKIAQLTQSQQQQARVARRQRAWLLAALGGLVLLSGGASLLWRLYRQKQRANALLATQKVQLTEQAARLGALDEAKNQFFANVSHELRTPLTLVLGPLDTLLTSPAAELPAAARAPVALAHRQAQRLEQLVNRILDLTKLQAGRLALQPQPTALAALLERVVGQFESLATQRGIALHGPAGLPDKLRLLLDASKVEEVLTNLLINALNHTLAGGTVRVTVALPGPDDLYGVTVHDTGPGIALAEQTRVFERFYQSPQGQAQGGTGLGLALSRELAHLLGGTLTLVSEAGRGAAFTLRFPAPVLPAVPAPAWENTPPAAPAELPPPPPPTGERPRVLVVEDQPDLREYLRTLLAPHYEVLLAEDGQAALEVLAREAPIDLVTTDAMMPRLSGIELLTRLKAEPAYQQLPVLMLTARADDTHRLAAFTTGVDDYLTKPFTTSELLARVRTLLTRHQVRRQFAALPLDEPAPGPEAEDLASAPALAASVGPALTAAPSSAARRKAEPPAAAARLAEWQAQVTGHLGAEDFGPAELASLLCLSERTLYRRLGELAGLTPAAWLRELRLDQARRLLEADTYRSVAEVADAVGFASPRYFAVLYAERFGRRPADYRPPA